MKFLNLMHHIVWGPWTLVLFLGTGLWFTVRLNFFQITGAAVWWRMTFGSFRSKSESGENGHGISAFQSACTALAATVGTGNIAGVATALTAGGPGAVFWMWVSAAIGMMTAYAETYLGQVFRYRRLDGSWMGGPMIYMERGLHVPELGVVYAVFAILASLGMGSMVQANAIRSTVQYYAPVSGWLCGILLAAGTWLVIAGGIKRIAGSMELLMPVSAGIYIVFSVIVILSCLEMLPDILQIILRDALHPRAAAGGVCGFLLSSAVRYGLARGTFSNEAGLGSLAVLHGAAEDTTPERQGMWAMFAVFVDTIVICTLTALVLLCAGFRGTVPAGLDGAALASWSFSGRIGNLGSLLVSASMIVFAFATIVAWYYVGEQMVEYLWVKAEKIIPGSCNLENAPDGRQQRVRALYRVLYLGAVSLGCLGSLNMVWILSDIANGLMAFPNLMTIIVLSNRVKIPKS